MKEPNYVRRTWKALQSIQIILIIIVVLVAIQTFLFIIQTANFYEYAIIKKDQMRPGQIDVNGIQLVIKGSNGTTDEGFVQVPIKMPAKNLIKQIMYVYKKYYNQMKNGNYGIVARLASPFFAISNVYDYNWNFFVPKQYQGKIILINNGENIIVLRKKD